MRGRAVQSIGREQVQNGENKEGQRNGIHEGGEGGGCRRTVRRMHGRLNGGERYT